MMCKSTSSDRIDRAVRWAVIATLLLGAGVANAATVTWTANGGGGEAARAWTTNGFWNATHPNAVGDKAIFGTGNRRIPDISSVNITVGIIQFTGGSGNYTIQGSQTLILDNTGSTNALIDVDTGDQTISVANITLNDHLDMDVASSTSIAINSIIGGSSKNVSKIGAGTATLGGANTYSGTTMVTAGTLRIGASDRLANASNLTVNGGSFDLQAFTDTVATVSLTSGSIIGSGTLTGSVYNVQAGTISAKLGGSGIDLNKSTAGTVIMSGANTYTGTTTITAGTIQLGASNVFADASDIVINGGTLDIGAFSDTVTSVTVNEGSILGTTGVLSAASFIIVEENVTIDAILAGATAPLTKQDAGTTTLSKANTYGGETAINAGKLKLNGQGKIHSSAKIKVAAGAEFDVAAVTGGPYTIQNGQTLTGGGTVIGDIVFASGSILAPGNSPGTTTHADGDETWEGGGTYEWEINLLAGTQGADPGWDFVNITDGQLIITATDGNEFVIEILSLTGANVAGVLSDWDSGVNHTWTIVTASAGIDGFDADAFTLNDSQFTAHNALNGGSFSIAQSGNSINLVFTAFVEPSVVPTPGAMPMIVAAMAGAMLRRRRR